jgi:hypothetical protein
MRKAYANGAIAALHLGFLNCKASSAAPLRRSRSTPPGGWSNLMTSPDPDGLSDFLPDCRKCWVRYTPGPTVTRLCRREDRHCPQFRTS